LEKSHKRKLINNLNWSDGFQDINMLDLEKLKEQFLKINDNYDVYKTKLEENVNKIKDAFIVKFINGKRIK